MGRNNRDQNWKNERNVLAAIESSDRKVPDMTAETSNWQQGSTNSATLKALIEQQQQQQQHLSFKHGGF